MSQLVLSAMQQSAAAFASVLRTPGADVFSPAVSGGVQILIGGLAEILPPTDIVRIHHDFLVFQRLLAGTQDQGVQDLAKGVMIAVAERIVAAAIPQDRYTQAVSGMTSTPELRSTPLIRYLSERDAIARARVITDRSGKGQNNSPDKILIPEMNKYSAENYEAAIETALANTNPGARQVELESLVYNFRPQKDFEVFEAIEELLKLNRNRGLRALEYISISHPNVITRLNAVDLMLGKDARDLAVASFNNIAAETTDPSGILYAGRRLSGLQQSIAFLEEKLSRIAFDEEGNKLQRIEAAEFLVRVDPIQGASALRALMDSDMDLSFVSRAAVSLGAVDRDYALSLLERAIQKAPRKQGSYTTLMGAMEKLASLDRENGLSMLSDLARDETIPGMSRLDAISILKKLQVDRAAIITAYDAIIASQNSTIDEDTRKLAKYYKNEFLTKG